MIDLNYMSGSEFEFVISDLNKKAQTLVINADEQEHLEIECNIRNVDGEKISLNQFKDTIDKLDNDDNFIKMNPFITTTLDINKSTDIDSNKRLSVNGIVNIQLLCKHKTEFYKEYQNGYEIIIKSLKDKNKSVFEEYGVTFKISIEKTLKDQSKINTSSEFDISENVNVRYKKRYSYLTKSKLFRIDLTDVKQKGGVSNINDILNRMQNIEDIFEMEIEYIGNINDFYKESTISEFSQTIDTIIRYMNNSYIIISKTDMNIIQKAYTTLIGGDKFIGAEVVSLEMSDVYKLNLDNPKYTLTDKADGERYMLFINDNKLFLITKKRIIPTGMIIENYNKSLFDGELIKISNHKDIYRYLIFDCLFITGIDIRKEKLLDRYEKIKSFVQQIEPQMHKLSTIPFTIDYKIYKIPISEKESIYELSKNLWNKRDTLDYNLDGMIYTPNVDYFKYSTTNKIYKWKPAEYMSIDFNVKILKTFGTELEVDLRWYNGFKKHNETAMLLDGTKLSGIHIPAIIGETDVVLDNSVCEFILKNGNWIPIRYRKDKENGNAIMTCKSIMKLILNYVSFETISTGIVDERYMRFFKSIVSESAGKPIRDFHNYVKSNVIKTIVDVIRKSNSKNKINLLDIGVGRGGDILKWIQNGINYIIGVDKSQAEIDVALERIKRINKKETKIELIVGDPTEKNLQLNTKVKFNFITSMFSLHFFIENKKNLENLFTNIDKYTDSGAYFTAVCFNGNVIKQKLCDSENVNHKIQPINIENRNIWEISLDNINCATNEYFGQSIISTFTTFDNVKEYLVFPDAIRKVAESKGFKPVGLFGTEYYTSFEHFYDQYIKDGKGKLSDDDKLYSFLNIVMVFQKQ